MNVGETNNTLRRLYLTIFIDDGSALATTAAVAPPAHALQVSINGAAFVDAGGTLVHLGDGSYYYEATAGEVATAGFLAFKYQATGFRTEIDWTQVGRPFLLGETSPTLLRLPLTIFDLASPPALATGATAGVGDLKISVNGAAYVNASGSLVQVGSGLYYYQATTADAAAGGIIVIKYKPASTFAEMVTWQSIDSPAQSFTAALTSSTTPGQLDPNPDVARWIPIHLSFVAPAGYHVVINAQIGLDSALWMTAYDEQIAGDVGDAALAPLFSDKSSVSIAGSFSVGRTVTMDVLPNGGWQRPDVKLVPYLAVEMT